MKKQTNTVLLVGASGSGKDTLLRAALHHFRENERIHFVPRYITRVPDENEKNYYIDTVAFDFLRTRDFFVSHWQAHGNYYGISRHHLNEVSQGRMAVISTSRTVIADFENHNSSVTTIFVHVSQEILRQRLEGRKRESHKEIEKRLARSQLPVKASNLLYFDNSTPLDISEVSFIALLEKIMLGSG